MPSDKCSNPFKYLKHKKENARKIEGSQIIGKNVPKILYLCDKCRKKVSKEGWPDDFVIETPHILKVEGDMQFESKNESDEDWFPDEKDIANLGDAFHFSEIVKKMKNLFQNPLTSNLKKNEILTLMPDSWSDRKVAKLFCCSRSLVMKARQGTDNKNCGHPLSDEVKNSIINFYENDVNSRILPGKKDFISVKQVDGTRIHVPKRLILCNLSELFNLFKNKHPNCKVGFSTFARLRPKHCVLAGSSGTHSVCVCTYHENVHLMIDGASIPSLTKSTDLKLTSYKDFLKIMVCDNPTPSCHFGECQKCQDNIDTIKNYLEKLFESEGIDEIKYQLWESTDRSTLLTRLQETDEFIQELCEKLIVLRQHDFLARQQASYLDLRKQTLQEGEVLVFCDFAENYAFIAQNAAQTFHWNNDQVSIHTVVYYYVQNQELKHHSMAILSDDLKHNTTAVHAFQKILINHLRERNIPLTNIIYFTDGAAQHYKNRFNFSNLMKHKEDFGVDAEWHFHATAHGKGPCDGIGGNLKRLAARASLQRPSSEQILTANALFKWATENLLSTSVYFSSQEEHNILEASLKDRFSAAKTIPGTQKYHSFIPMGDDKISLRVFSFSEFTTVFPANRGRKRKNIP